MIDEAKLKEWEKLCDKDRLCDCVFEDFGIAVPRQSKRLTYAFADKALDIIPQLIARVRELEKEADWLASELSCRTTAEKWREEARKAVRND